MSSQAAFWIMLGFVIAFIVKLPVVPFHPWLPDAHTEAPTAGSVVLAGLLLKTGAYGLLRFVLPLFPDAVATIGPIMLVLGVIGIIYGAVLAFGQTDLKRLVAYTSVSHIAFVLIGIFAGNQIALSGRSCRWWPTASARARLFIIVGTIQERVHTREMGSWAGSGQQRRDSAASVSSLPWPRSACRVSVISLPSSWCCSAHTGRTPRSP